jgi:hypothetical protein
MPHFTFRDAVKAREFNRVSDEFITAFWKFLLSVLLLKLLDFS